MTRTWIVLSFLVACTGGLAQDTNSSKSMEADFVRLSDYLMKGYRNGMRPVQDWRHTTTVYINIIIYAILGVDEKNQLLRTYIWSVQSWEDEFLNWEPQEFDNVTYISIPAHMIWIPDITVLEFVETTRSPETPFVYVNHKGYVRMKKPLLISTVCNLDIYYFPFDTQKCTISFTSRLHKVHDVNVSLMDTKMSDFKSNYMTVGEWDLIKVLPTYKLIHDHDIQFGEIEYTLIIRRKPLFYTINLILPSMFLMIIDIGGFYLPPECGERISFKITLLLGYSVFLVVVKDILPATGTPLIGIYFIMCMSLLVTSLIESIFIVRMVHQQNIHHEIPAWVKILILEKMASLLRIKNWDFARPYNATYDNSQHMENEKGPHCSKENAQDNVRVTEKTLSVTKKLDLLTSILKELMCIKDDVKDFTHKRITKEWLQVGYILDAFFYRMYLSVVIVYAASLMIIWSSKFHAYK